MKKQAQDLGAELRPGVVHQIVSLGSSFALSLGADFIEAERIILCTAQSSPSCSPAKANCSDAGSAIAAHATACSTAANASPSSRRDRKP